jgi:hypothetical protein
MVFLKHEVHSCAARGNRDEQSSEDPANKHKRTGIIKTWKRQEFEEPLNAESYVRRLCDRRYRCQGTEASTSRDRKASEASLLTTQPGARSSTRDLDSGRALKEAAG